MPKNNKKQLQEIEDNFKDQFSSAEASKTKNSQGRKRFSGIADDESDDDQPSEVSSIQEAKKVTNLLNFPSATVNNIPATVVTKSTNAAYLHDSTIDSSPKSEKEYRRLCKESVAKIFEISNTQATKTINAFSVEQNLTFRDLYYYLGDDTATTLLAYDKKNNKLYYPKTDDDKIASSSSNQQNEAQGQQTKIETTYSDNSFTTVVQENVSNKIQEASQKIVDKKQKAKKQYKAEKPSPIIQLISAFIADILSVLIVQVSLNLFLIIFTDILRTASFFEWSFISGTLLISQVVILRYCKAFTFPKKLQAFVKGDL